MLLCGAKRETNQFVRARCGIGRSILLILASLLILAACRNPFQDSDSKSKSFGTITVSVVTGGSSRTVVPNYVAQVHSIEVSLVSNDGYPTLTDTVSVSPWQVTFNDVRSGRWDITVVAKNLAGLQIGSGSVLGQVLDPGANLTIPITVAFSSTAPTGDVAFTVSFPSTDPSAVIDYVTGTIIETSATSTPAVVDNGDGTHGATLTFSGLSTGTYSLEVTFRRGGSTGEVAGVFREKVIVVQGFTSGSWVASDGSLVSKRAFTAADLFVANASLANLVVTTVLPSGFDSGQTDYPMGVFHDLASITFRATKSVDGQWVQYQWNGGVLTEIVPDGTTNSAVLPLIDDTGKLGNDNTLDVAVRAPDKQTWKHYTVEFSRNFSVSYDGNGNTSLPATIPSDSNWYEAGVLVNSQPQGGLARDHYTFLGWTINYVPAINGEPDILAGDSFSMPSGDTTLHATWQQTAIVTVDITFDTPTYGAITFTSPTTVLRDTTLNFTTSLTGWKSGSWSWYVDNVPVSHTDPPFAWNTTGLQPGQYIINADATYVDAGGKEHPCTGSVLVTVTY